MVHNTAQLSEYGLTSHYNRSF